jgi:hypothetical protein
MINLDQLLREQRYRDEPPPEERRAHERHSLGDASGELYYRGVKYPCALINVGMGGCCVATPRRFTGGALAHVEVVLPVCGMVLRLVGTTIWANEDNRLGVRFLHPSAKSKNQVAGLISCLIDQVAAAAVQEEAARKEAEAAAAAAALLQQDGDLTSAEAIAAADRHVHGEQRRIRSYVPGEWPAVLRSAALQLHAPGALADISLNGCVFRTSKTLTVPRNSNLEIEFEIRALHFRLAARAVVIYNPFTVGLHFEDLGDRRREELSQMLDELGGGGAYIASHSSFAEDHSTFGKSQKDEDDFDDWGDTKIIFRD